MNLTLADIVGGAISDDEAVRARYLEWISKAKAELVGASAASATAVKAASDLRKELAATKKSVVKERSKALCDELKATCKKLDAHAKSASGIRLKYNKGKPSSIKADSTISEILSELLGRLGITEHVAQFSALVDLAEKSRSVSKSSDATNSPNSLGDLATQTTNGPSLMSLLSKAAHLVKNSVRGGMRGMRGMSGGSSSKCTTVMGVMVCDSMEEGQGFPDGPSFGRRYVIHTDCMTLERGPGFRVDAFDVLERSLATFEIATSNIAKDKDHSRAYVLLLLDALAEAFKMPAAHKSHSGGSHSGKRGGGSRMVKITTTAGGCAKCAEEHVSRLEQMGIVKHSGGADKIVYVQNVPTADQQRMNNQHLKNDTYFSTCFGCLVFIEACQCCMECSEYLSDE